MRDGKISERVTWVGAVDWDRRFFDALIPLPDGTTYNSWLVRGSEKAALIDAVDPAFTDVLMRHLDEADVRNLDYVVANHAEQDHSGSLPAVLNRYPTAKVLCTEKCRGMLIDLLHLPLERVKSVADGEDVSLGDRTLKFIHFPWVHWPETMLTWVPEEVTLFSCDLFGAHLAQSSLFVTDEAAFLFSAKRYYAEIMMPFRTIIEKNLHKVENLDVKCIAMSHGPVNSRPALLINAYKEWTSSIPKNLVALPYISMHNSTRLMVQHLVDALAVRGVAVEQFDLIDADIGKLAMALVDAATIVIGTPTVLVGAHPKVAYAAFLVNALRPKAKQIAFIGSYGWGGKAVEQLTSILTNLKAEALPSIMAKGLPVTTDYAALDNLAGEIGKRHEGLK